VVTLAALLVALWYVDVQALLATLGRLDRWNFAAVVVALLGGAVLSSYRLKLIAGDIGYRISLRDAVAALSLGQIAGSLFFQIVGQLIARGAVLSRRGMPVAGTVVLTGYERLAALLVSLALALAGGIFLFGRITLDIGAGGADFIKLAVGGALVVAAGAWLGWGGKASANLRAISGPKATGQIVRNIALSLLVQLSTMAAYIAAARGLVPSLPLADVAAAAAVVMLAASLPTSLAGWGVRELGAIYALGVVGLPNEAALAVALVIGLVALGVVAVLAVVAIMLPTGRKIEATSSRTPAPSIDHNAVLAWSVPIIAAMAVFFQVHLPLTTSRLNVNLADPVAILGGALFALACLRDRTLPAWRLPWLNAHVVAATLVLTFALVLGWDRYGWTSWAFVNRFAGWFILLAYAATGALLIGRAGAAGFEILLRTFVAAAIALVALDVAIFAAVGSGVAVPRAIVKYRSEGFAQNANAFAVQLLLAFACVAAMAQGPRVKALLLTGIFVGLWFTGSRSGMGALAVAIAVALFMRAAPLRVLIVAGLATLGLVALVNWLPEIIGVAIFGVQRTIAFLSGLFQGEVVAGASGPTAIPHPDFSSLTIIGSGFADSSAQRIESLRGGWAMFVAHPVFGGGLGAFIEEYTRTLGQPLVIHSTPLWLMAEMGVIGLFVFIAPFIRIIRRERFARAPDDPAGTFLVIALLGFAVVAMVHDMFYQRALWLLLGAALAHGARERSSRHAVVAPH
jgi:Lysylphosphatidylglycerol synthase TM region/O-Antigen ligase